MLTVLEIAALTGCQETEVYAAINSGELKPDRGWLDDGGALRFTCEQRWIHERMGKRA